MILLNNPCAAGIRTPVNSLVLAAHAEFVELQVLDTETFRLKTLATIEHIDRNEVLAYEGDKLIGASVMAVDHNEIHVGLCLTVVFNYVLPEYRGTDVASKIYRIAYTLAKHLGLPVVARTRRLGDWRYETYYRRVHGKNS